MITENIKFETATLSRERSPQSRHWIRDWRKSRMKLLTNLPMGMS